MALMASTLFRMRERVRKWWFPAALCMDHRNVDGLDNWQPRDDSMYAQMGRHLASEGHCTPSIRPPVDDASQAGSQSAFWTRMLAGFLMAARLMRGKCLAKRDLDCVAQNL